MGARALGWERRMFQDEQHNLNRHKRPCLTRYQAHSTLKKKVQKQQTQIITKIFESAQYGKKKLNDLFLISYFNFLFIFSIQLVVRTRQL